MCFSFSPQTNDFFFIDNQTLFMNRRFFYYQKAVIYILNMQRIFMRLHVNPIRKKIYFIAVYTMIIINDYGYYENVSISRCCCNVKIPYVCY